MKINPGHFVPIVAWAFTAITPGAATGQCGECLQWTQDPTALEAMLLGVYDPNHDVLMTVAGPAGRIYVQSNGVWSAQSVFINTTYVIDFWQKVVYLESRQTAFSYLVGSVDSFSYSPETQTVVLGDPADNPQAQFGSSVSEFESRGSIIIFGGDPLSQQPPIDTTIEFDPAQDTYTVLDTPDAPSPRGYAGTAYDGVRQRIVLFGGSTDFPSGAVLDDTWEFDGANWVEVPPVDGIRPPARSHAAMAFDSSRGVVVMTGGRTPDAPYWKDTWEWDGSTWTQRLPGSSTGTLNVPSYALAFDKSSGEFKHFLASPFLFTLGGVAANPPSVDPPAPPLVQRMPGEIVLLNVSAQGDYPLAYQWRKDGVPIPGATVANHLLGAVYEGHEGRYDCVVRYNTGLDFDCGRTISDPIYVDVLGPSCRTMDLDRNGEVDLRDFSVFQAQFGRSCP